MKKLNWGIIGTGWIAHEMGATLQEENGEIYAVCGTSKEKAEKFAQEFSVEKAYGNTEDLFSDEVVDIIYIATPHNTHYELMKKAIAAGKHVLCEKSITVNSSQLEECVALAKEKGVVVSDAMTIFHMPLYKKLKKMIENGAIGEVKMVQVNFGSCKEYDVTNRFFSKELAGGALLDIGVYASSFARYFMHSKPNVVLTTANYFETGVDETSGILMKNPDGEMAVIALTMRAKQPKRGVVAGEKGFIEIYDYPRAAKATITYTEDGHTEVIEEGHTEKALQYEVQDMQDYIWNHGGEENIAMVQDVMDILTSVRSQWGMVYPFE
ncbi:MAG: Gfo/Idh/MocA family oxidoreductase [Anaerostipes sp.]|nr:Gfo/Idh/MocA family oxidoreductase [Anaerostipes sp.]